MNRALLPNLVVLTFGLAAPVAGLGWFWRGAETALRHAAVKPPSLETEEQRIQGWDFWTIEIDSLAAELKEERARQQKQAEQLELREGRLASEQQELERLRGELTALRADIDRQVMMVAADELKNLRTLAQTYTNLSPRGAVAIVRELDDITVVKILALMKPDVVGAIFEEMSKTGGPEAPLARRAAVLSEKLRLIKVAPPNAATS